MSVSPFHRGHEAAGSRDEQQTGHPGFFCSSHLSCSGLMSRAGSNPGQRWTGIFGSAPQRKQTNTREATACEGHPEGQEAFQGKEVLDPSHWPEEEMFFPLPPAAPLQCIPSQAAMRGQTGCGGEGQFLYSPCHIPQQRISAPNWDSPGAKGGGAWKPVWGQDSSSPHRGWAGGAGLGPLRAEARSGDSRRLREFHIHSDPLDVSTPQNSLFPETTSLLEHIAGRPLLRPLCPTLRGLLTPGTHPDRGLGFCRNTSRGVHSPGPRLSLREGPSRRGCGACGEGKPKRRKPVPLQDGDLLGCKTADSGTVGRGLVRGNPY